MICSFSYGCLHSVVGESLKSRDVYRSHCFLCHCVHFDVHCSCVRAVSRTPETLNLLNL